MVKRRCAGRSGGWRGYLLTLSNCVKWFPERKGLISRSLSVLMVWVAWVSNLSTRTAGNGRSGKNLCDLGSDCAGMIVFGATLMKDAPKQEVKTRMVWWRKITRWQSRCVNRSTDVSGNVPDCLHERPVRDWGSKDIAQSLAHLDVVSAANAVTLFPSPTFQVVWCWAFCLTKCPYPCYHHWSGDFAGGYGGPLFAPLNAVTFFAAIACVAFNLAALLPSFRHWSVSSSASITGEKLRCDLPRFRYR